MRAWHYYVDHAEPCHVYSNILMNSYTETVRVGVAGRDRVCRRGAAPPARAGIPAVRIAAAMGRRARPRGTSPRWSAVGCDGRAARHRRARRGSTPCSWRCPEHAAAEVAPLLLARGKRVFDLSGAFRLARRRAASSLVSENARAAVGVVYRLDRAEPRSAARRDAGRVPGLLSDRRDARAAAAAPGRADRAADHHRRQVGHLGAGKTPTERTHFSRESRQPVGLRRLQPPARRRDRAGAQHAGDLRAAPGADRSRHPRDDLRDARAGHDEAAIAAALHAAYASRRSCGSPAGELPEIKHVAHTNFCDIGWKVNDAARPARARRRASTTW